MAIDVDANELAAANVANDTLYEVIGGRIVEPPPMGTEQAYTAGILHMKLASFVDATNIGHAVVEMLFDFSEQNGRKRRPDVAYVSNDRWPRRKPVGSEDGWQVVPNLAVEVISPTNTWDDVVEKIYEYFQVGVERVWVVTTSKKQVQVFASPKSVRIFDQDDVLCDELLSGFSLPLVELFKMVAS